MIGVDDVSKRRACLMMFCLSESIEGPISMSIIIFRCGVVYTLFLFSVGQKRPPFEVVKRGWGTFDTNNTILILIVV